MSREGTKIHALADALGRPIRLMLSPGQAWDGHAAEQLLTALPEGCRLLADRATLGECVHSPAANV